MYFLYIDSNVPILKLQKTTSMKEDPTNSQQATQAEPKLCASQNQPFVSILLYSKARSLLADLSRACYITKCKIWRIFEEHTRWKFWIQGRLTSFCGSGYLFSTVMCLLFVVNLKYLHILLVTWCWSFAKYYPCFNWFTSVYELAKKKCYSGIVCCFNI